MIISSFRAWFNTENTAWCASAQLMRQSEIIMYNNCKRKRKCLTLQRKDISKLAWSGYLCLRVNLYQNCNIHICSGKQHTLASKLHYHNILSLHSNLVHPFLPKMQTLISIFAKTVIQSTPCRVYVGHPFHTSARTNVHRRHNSEFEGGMHPARRILFWMQNRCYCRCGWVGWTNTNTIANGSVQVPGRSVPANQGFGRNVTPTVACAHVIVI